MNYNVLDSYLCVFNSGYETLEQACEHLENQDDTNSVVRYVEDEGGDLVALVYSGASWFPGIKQEIVIDNGRLAEGVDDGV